MTFYIQQQVCAEMQYLDGEDNPVHSDLCPNDHTVYNLSDEARAMYHRCLDEWIDKSEGSGYFFIGDNGYHRIRDNELAAVAAKLKPITVASELKKLEGLAIMKMAFGEVHEEGTDCPCSICVEMAEVHNAAMDDNKEQQIVLGKGSE